MAGPVENRMVVNGFTVLASSWRVLGKGGVFTLPSKFDLVELSSDQVQGISSLKGCSSAKISFTERNGLDISQVIACNIKKGMLDRFWIRREYLRAIDYAISKLGTDKKTYRQWQNLHCKFFTEFIERQCKLCSNQVHEVYSQDLAEFGWHFQDYFQRQATRVGCKTWLMGTVTGQQDQYRDAYGQFSLLNLEHAEEVTMCFVREFVQPTKCLLWSRERVRKCFPGVAPEEFYPAFIGGFGNFKFDYTHRRVPIVADEGYGEGGGISTQTIEFCSEAFGTLRRLNPVPFKEAAVVSVMTGLDNGQRIQELLQWLKTVEKNVNAFSVIGKLEAHLKVIMTSTKDFASTSSCLETFRTCFENQYGIEHRQLLDAFEMHTFVDQARRSIMPAVYTLQRILEYVPWRAPILPHIFKLNTASVCEMLICFGLYGQVLSCRSSGTLSSTLAQEEYYLQHFKQMLGLETYRFYHPMWKGLDFMNAVRVKELSLRYTGPNVVLKNVYAELEQEAGPDAVDIINQVLVDIYENKLDEKGDYADHASFHKLNKIIWTSLSNYAQQQMFPKKANPHQHLHHAEEEEGQEGEDQEGVDLNRMLAKLEDKRLIPKTSIEFVTYIFTAGNLKQHSITQIIDTLRYAMGTLQNYDEHLALFIEQEMYKSNLALFYPAGNGDWISVMPLYRIPFNTKTTSATAACNATTTVTAAATIGFSTLEPEKKQKMLSLYKFVLKKVSQRENVTAFDAIVDESDDDISEILYGMEEHMFGSISMMTALSVMGNFST